MSALVPEGSYVVWEDAAGVKHSDLAGHKRRRQSYGNCILCQENRELRLSHIEPKWAVRMFTGKTVFHTVGNQFTVVPRQDAPKYYLLCAQCEEYLSYAEQHLAIICRGRSTEMARHGVTVSPHATASDFSVARIEGYDYKRIARALFGILLKAHYSPGHLKSEQIPGVQVDRIRQRILLDDYNLNAHEIHAVKWFDVRPVDVSPVGAIYTEYVRGQGFSQAAVTLGGFTFFLTLKGKDVALMESAREAREAGLYLGAQGPWCVMVGDVANWRGAPTYLKHFGKFDLYQMVKIARNLRRDGWRPEEEMCPCGFGDIPFRQCCCGRWISPEWLYREVRRPFVGFDKDLIRIKGIPVLVPPGVA